jgi:putative PEP-CTERM system TPR-repeat lipoprotein
MQKLNMKHTPVKLEQSFKKSTFSVGMIAAVTCLAVGLVGCKESDSSDALIKDAKAAIEKQDSKSAEIHLKNVLQKEDSQEARALLGKLYSANGDFRSSEKELRRAIELGGDRNVLVVPLMDALFQLGEYQKVVDDSKNMVVTDKASGASIATLVGKSLAALNKKEEAKAILQASLASNPADVPTKVALISLKVADGDKKTAVADLDQLIATDPSSVDAHILKGDLELAEGNLEAAKKLYVKVAQLSPTNALARAKLAAIFIDLSDFKASEEQINELQKLSPNSPGTLYLRALLSYRQGKNDVARDLVLASLKSAPDYLPSITLAGNISLSLGTYDLAERYARTIIERAPTALQGYRLLGATYLKMNAPERALQTVQPMIDKGAQDSTLFSIAGEALLKSNDAVKASQYFEKAAKLDPKDPTKRTGLALSRMAAGDREKAFAELEEAVQIDTKNYQADFALIMARVRDKDFPKALEAVNRLDQKLPNSPIPPNMRGLIALAKNDDAGAKTAFEAALKADPVFFAAAANLASLDMKAKQPELAKKRYEDILKADPKNAQAFIALARHTQRIGGTNKEAAEYLKKGRAANPGTIPPVIALANFYLESNEPKEALPVLQDALNANPDRQDLLDLLGTTYMRLNDRAQAMETYEKLLRLNPKSAATHYRVGELRLQAKDETAAIQNFRKSAELQPDAPEPQIAIATVLVRQGKIDEAKKIAAALKKELPSSAAGLALEGDLAIVAKQPIEAAVAFKKALAIERQVGIGVKLHRALLAGGKQAEAQGALEDWFKADPNDGTMRLYAGEFSLSQRRWQDSIDNYSFVLKQDARHAVALNNTAWALSQLGENTKAVAMAEQAYAVAPSSPPIIDTLGTILIQAGNTTRGLELLKQAVTLAPKQTEYRLHLAEAHVKLGEKDSAKKELDTIIKESSPGVILEAAKAMAAKL